MSATNLWQLLLLPQCLSRHFTVEKQTKCKPIPASLVLTGFPQETLCSSATVVRSPKSFWQLDTRTKSIARNKAQLSLQREDLDTDSSASVMWRQGFLLYLLFYVFHRNTCLTHVPLASLVGSTCEAQEHWSYLSSAEGCSLTLVQAAGRSEWPSRLAPADIRQGQNWWGSVHSGEMCCASWSPRINTVLGVHRKPSDSVTYWL